MNEDEQNRQRMQEIYDGERGNTESRNGSSGLASKASQAFSFARSKGKAVLGRLGNLGKLGARPVVGLAASPHVVVTIVVIIAILLIVIFLVGIFAFLLLGPESVRGMLVKFADDIWTSVKGVFYGQAEAQVKEEQILEVAEYLENMGYSLEGYGFGEVTRDESTGKITSVAGPYLLAYLAAENKTYMIANDNFNFSAMFKNLSTIFDIGDGNWGDGMIVINQGLLSKNPKSVNIDRVKKVMEVHMKGSENSKVEKVYEYNLDGWMGRYGKPIEFLLALHTGTMAPDLAYEVATGSEFNTKVYVKFKRVGIITKYYYTGPNGVKAPLTTCEIEKNGQKQTIKGWAEYVRDETENWEKYNSSVPAERRVDVSAKVKEIYGINMKDVNAAQAKEKSGTYYYYKPYIRAVTNHWFRDLDFSKSYRVGNREGVVVGSDGAFEVVEDRTDDIYQVKEPKIVGKLKESKIFADEIDDLSADNNGNTTASKTAKASEKSTTDDNSTSAPTDGTADYEGYKLDKLFEQEYNIADGITGVSEDKRKVNAKRTLQYGITMLENVHSEDAACILRDLKRYMSKRGFIFKDQYVITDPSKIKDYEDDRKLDYGGTKYSRPSNSGGTVTQKPLGGILDGTTGGVEIKDNYTIILHHKSANNSDGFETGAIVKSPGAGSVVNVDQNTIMIRLTTAGAEGKTITITGFNVDTKNIKRLSKVKKGQQIGTTGDGDITITMVDEQGKPVNPANYLPIISAAENEILALEKIVMGEARGEPFEGKVAVAAVVLNRVADRDSGFPNDIISVINDGGGYQFNGVNWDGEISDEARNAVKAALAGADPVKLSSGKALFFCNPVDSGVPSSKTEQAISSGVGYRIGNHVFGHIEWWNR